MALQLLREPPHDAGQLLTRLGRLGVDLDAGLLGRIRDRGLRSHRKGTQLRSGRLFAFLLFYHRIPAVLFELRGRRVRHLVEGIDGLISRLLDLRLRRFPYVHELLRDLTGFLPEFRCHVGGILAGGGAHFCAGLLDLLRQVRAHFVRRPADQARAVI